MDQEIFEIIDRNLMLDMPFAEEAKRDTAKEIAKHFEKFIEWIEFDTGKYSLELNRYAKKWHPIHGKYKEYTLREAYQYYCDNVLNLKQK